MQVLSGLIFANSLLVGRHLAFRCQTWEVPVYGVQTSHEALSSANSALLRRNLRVMVIRMYWAYISGPDSRHPSWEMEEKTLAEVLVQDGKSVQRRDG